MARGRSSEDGSRRAQEAEDSALSARLRRLGERLDRLTPQAPRPPTGNQEIDLQMSNGSSGFGRAMRLSSDFVGGVFAGAFIGWLVDRLAGTSPWGLIVFILLGFTAGTLNVLRSARITGEQDFGQDKK